MSVKQRRKYDPEFKKNAVLLTEEPGRTVSDVAESLGVKADLLYRWRRHSANGCKSPSDFEKDAGLKLKVP